MALRDPLSAADVAARLAGLHGWTGDQSMIEKTYRIGWDQAVAMVADIGRAAIELEHRPDLDIRWDHLHVAMTTHTAGDVVTELDFVTAQRLDEIAARHSDT